ncbi:MAG: glutamyl-tRNA reductase [Desulfobulbaceae bacterium]|nr:glutamyl-tRNA reductase [Desulfobulbaceae bacterium]
MWADSIMAIGVNHKTAPVAVREQLTFAGDCQTPLRQLQAIDGCDECYFLSTCNRVEVLFVSRDPETTLKAVRKFLFSGTSLSEEEIDRYSYLHQGQDAINHLFLVAASLDSMIVGEPQILGQLKQAYREASDGQTTGPILNRLLHKAFSVAKRVRTETNIGGGAASISYAAVQLARKIFGELTGKRVMLIGAGEMAELAAEHLVAQGIDHVLVANRTLERAATLARTFNGTAISLPEVVNRIPEVDIVISSTGATDLILRRDEIRPLMRQRHNRPLFLIDIAVPRDLDPMLNTLDNVYLYDIDDLTNVVEVNKSERAKEAASAERIVAEEVLKFRQWLENMEVAPTIAAIRRQGEAIKEQELAKTLASLGNLSEKEKKAVQGLAASIVNKMLHHPMLYLKTDCKPDEKKQKLDMARKLFNLDAAPDDGSSGMQ